jgi:hypothetical protein
MADRVHPAEAGAARPRLDDVTVRELLDDLDGALAGLEQAPDGGPALDAVAVLLEVYGEALARIVDRVGPATREALATDELVGHLLALHDLRPPEVERSRPEQASRSAFIPVEALAFSASRAAS